MSILDLALQALDRGWSICPVKCKVDEKGKVKKPASVKWLKYRDQRVEKSQVFKQWRPFLKDEPAIGYAVICGEISNLFVVDVDTKEAEEKVLELMGDLETYTVQTPSGGYHYYFQHTEGFQNGASIGIKGLDVRTYGGYVVGHGGSYPDGRPYVLNKDIEIKRIPEALKQYILQAVIDRNSPGLGSKQPTGNSDGAGKKGKGKSNWFNEIILNGFSEGQRIDQLKRVIGLLIGEQRDDDYIMSMVAMINNNSPDPLSQSELDEQAPSMLRSFRAKESVVQDEFEERICALNQKYAQITIGGKPMVMSFKTKGDGMEDFDLIQPAAMKAEVRHLVEWIGKKKFSRQMLWEESELRRRYQEIVFNPSDPPQLDYEHGDNGPYNLWSGFTVVPEKGDWSLFRQHLTEVMAPGHGDYVLKWLARMFQDPGGDRPGKVLVFRGKPGTGKSFTRSIIGKFFGRHYYKTDDIQHLIGKFNTAVANVIFLALEEAMWAGDRSQVGRLKERITSKTLAIEKKGIDVITMESHLNIIMNSNDSWVVPIQDDDRRFVVFDVLSKYINDRQYFGRIKDQMENGGYEAMLWDMLYEIPMTMECLKNSPKTDAGFDQYTQQKDSVLQFVLNCLSKGQLHPQHKGWKQVIKKSRLYDSYEAFCNRHRLTWKDSEHQFQKRVHNYLFLKRVRLRMGTLDKGKRKQIHVYQLPDLDSCRKFFTKDYETEWEEAEIDDILTTEERNRDYDEDYPIMNQDPF